MYILASCNPNIPSVNSTLEKAGKQTANTETDSTDWFPIDSLPTRIKPTFTVLSATYYAKIILDTTILLPHELKKITCMQMDGHQFQYTATHELSNDPVENSVGKFKAAKMTFDSYSVSLAKCTRLHINTEYNGKMSGLIFDHNDTPNIKPYHFLNIGSNTDYYVFMAASDGCGICGNEYAIIIKRSGNRTKFYLLEDIGDGEVLSFENWFWGAINKDENPDFYLLFHFGDEQRDGKYSYIPYSIIDDHLSILSGYSQYRFDFFKNKSIRY